MHYGAPVVRRIVPLALGLTSASNPVPSILETLSRYSHDNDLDVALNAIFAMGLVGAGTNNAKLAQMLRQLAVYYTKEPDCLFMVRIAQVRSQTSFVIAECCGTSGTELRLLRPAGSRSHGQGDDRSQSFPHGPVTDVAGRGVWSLGDARRVHRPAGLHPRQVPLDAVLPHDGDVPREFWLARSARRRR